MNPQDYRIIAQHRDSPYLIAAPHGGVIEPGTESIAAAIAGDVHSYYALIGRGAPGRDLHIPSTDLREPKLEALLAQSSTVIALHGAEETDEAYVMLGGLDAALRERISVALAAAGFSVRSPREGLAGEDETNFVNRGTSNMGVQLELTRALREQFRKAPEQQIRFSYAVRSVLMPKP
jgi:phage replication-related protein YjqB (UPF0714/DUF867 family)